MAKDDCVFPLKSRRTALAIVRSETEFATHPAHGHRSHDERGVILVRPDDCLHASLGPPLAGSHIIFLPVR